MKYLEISGTYIKDISKDNVTTVFNFGDVFREICSNKYFQ